MLLLFWDYNRLLKETKTEQGCFRGCLVAMLIGGLLGSGGGFFAAKSVAEQAIRESPGVGSNVAGGIYFLFLAVGFLIGAFLGGIIGLVIERVSAKREREANEF